VGHFNISRDNFTGETFLTQSVPNDPMEDDSSVRFLPQPDLNGGTVQIIISSGTYSTSATRPEAIITAKSRSGDNSVRSQITLDASIVSVANELNIASVLTAANEAYGSVSVAGGSGAVTTAPISYPALAGTGQITGFATAVTGSAAFVFAALTGLTSTGGTMNVLRNNATSTSVYFYVRRAL